MKSMIMIHCCRKSKVEMLRIIIILGDDSFYVEKGRELTKILKLIFYFFLISNHY